MEGKLIFPDSSPVAYGASLLLEVMNDSGMLFRGCRFAFKSEEAENFSVTGCWVNEKSDEWQQGVLGPVPATRYAKSTDFNMDTLKPGKMVWVELQRTGTNGPDSVTGFSILGTYVDLKPPSKT